MKSKKIPKSLKVLCCILLALTAVAVALFIWKNTHEYLAHIAPSAVRTDISDTVNKAQWSDADYSLLFAQTGVGRPGADALRAAGRQSDLFALQENFYKDIKWTCSSNSPISFEEKVTDGEKEVPGTFLVPLEDGDILITKSSHVYGWRNGHAALVVDAAGGRTLESVVLGTNSLVQDLCKWTKYPNFLVLRVKDATKEQREKIAQFAMQNLNNIPYDFTIGVLSAKEQENGVYVGTQCSHLVWAACKALGYDIDADGGMVVTPKDIANSPILEVVQVYGMDPAALWP